jgi:hypothetical protein
LAHVVFDMEQLAFVASAVMGALVKFRRGQRLLELFESADTVDQAFSHALL